MLDVERELARFVDSEAEVWETLYREARAEAVDQLARFVAWKRFAAIRAEVERRLAVAVAEAERLEKVLPGLESAAESAEATHRAAHARYEGALARVDRAEYRAAEAREYQKVAEPARAAGAAAQALQVARSERAVAGGEADRWRSLLVKLERREEPETPLLAELGLGAGAPEVERGRRRR